MHNSCFPGSSQAFGTDCGHRNKEIIVITLLRLFSSHLKVHIRTFNYNPSSSCRYSDTTVMKCYSACILWGLHPRTPHYQFSPKLELTHKAHHSWLPPGLPGNWTAHLRASKRIHNLQQAWCCDCFPGKTTLNLFQPRAASFRRALGGNGLLLLVHGFAPPVSQFSRSSSATSQWWHFPVLNPLKILSFPRNCSGKKKHGCQ